MITYGATGWITAKVFVKGKGMVVRSENLKQSDMSLQLQVSCQIPVLINLLTNSLHTVEFFLGMQ
jgi:hypothetical protein